MTELPEIIRRAIGLTVAITADLTVFGGILRCGECGAEQPVGDIAANVASGWPKCHDRTMEWVTRRQLLAEAREVPEGYELAAIVSDKWRLVSGKRCRAGAGYYHKACGLPSVAEFNRGTIAHPRWFAYCLDDMYANWVEGGQVWHWVLRDKGKADDR